LPQIEYNFKYERNNFLSWWPKFKGNPNDFLTYIYSHSDFGFKEIPIQQHWYLHEGPRDDYWPIDDEEKDEMIPRIEFYGNLTMPYTRPYHTDFLDTFSGAINLDIDIWLEIDLDKTLIIHQGEYRNIGFFTIENTMKSPPVCHLTHEFAKLFFDEIKKKVQEIPDSFKIEEDAHYHIEHYKPWKEVLIY